MNCPQRFARSNMLRDFGDATFRARREREHDRAAEANIESRVDALLIDARFDSNQIAALAARQRYPLSVQTLKREACIDEPTFIIFLESVAPRVAAYRAARTFNAIPNFEEVQPVTLATLRKLNSDEAGAARAFLSEIDWPVASRRIRAVFCLRALIGVRRS